MKLESNKIKCEHREDIMFRHEQVVTFPILRTIRKLKRKSMVLTDYIMQRLATEYNAHPPEGFEKIHQCEKLTVYQKSKSTQRHFVVKI
jgi:hypothetical protein